MAWGGAMGVISLLSCEAAGRIAGRRRGLRARARPSSRPSLAAFVVYNGPDLRFWRGDGFERRPDRPAAGDVPRMFLINACVFAGLGALFALGSAARRNGETAALTPRHV